MATQHVRRNAPGADWYGQSGLPDNDAGTPNAYARRLVRYISDPSTVRARTLDAYGKAPTREMISNWRDAWVAEKEWGRLARSPEEENEDNLVDQICTSVAQRIVGLEVDLPAVANDQPDTTPREPVALPSIDRSVPLATISEVLAECARVASVTVVDIVGPSRFAIVVRARQFAATVLRARGNSYPNVGRYIGDRDHSTIMHSVQQFFEIGILDPKYERAWMALAPCVTKMARSKAELDILMVPRA